MQGCRESEGSVAVGHRGSIALGVPVQDSIPYVMLITAASLSLCSLYF